MSLAPLKKHLFSVARLSAVSPLVWIAATFMSAIMLVSAFQTYVTGGLPDNDDYMRLQEVRDLLAGQAWSDTDQHRFVTDEGRSMHFSRLPDVPMAGLVAIARPIAGEHGAELFMGVFYTWMLFLGYLTAGNLIIREIWPRATAQWVLFTCSIPAVILLFMPGRIDHHGLQIMLAMGALLGAIRALDRPQWAAGSAIALVLMLAVGMETVVIAAATAIAVSIPWLMNGASRSLMIFAKTICVAAPLTLLVVTAGSSPFVATCDSYSLVQTFAALLAGGVAAALSLSTARMKSVFSRLFLAGLLGAVAGAIVIALFPACLAGPFGSLDNPLVLEWRKSLYASQSFFTYLGSHPEKIALNYGPAFIGIAGAIYLLLRSEGIQRQRWLVVLAFLVPAFFVSLWMLRATIMALSFAIFSSAVLASQAAAFLEQKKLRGYLKYILVVTLISPVSSIVLAAQLGKPAAPESETVARIEPENCEQSNSDFTFLNNYPEGLVLTQINEGAEVLALTHHRMISAPYHRNKSGIVASLGVFTAPPAEAMERMKESGADYLLFCPTGAETRYYSKLHPDGLVVKLAAGETPDWLQPLDMGDSLIQLFRFAPELAPPSHTGESVSASARS